MCAAHDAAASGRRHGQQAARNGLQAAGTPCSGRPPSCVQLPPGVQTASKHAASCKDSGSSLKPCLCKEGDELGGVTPVLGAGQHGSRQHGKRAAFFRHGSGWLHLQAGEWQMCLNNGQRRGRRQQGGSGGGGWVAVGRPCMPARRPPRRESRPAGPASARWHLLGSRCAREARGAKATPTQLLGNSEQLLGTGGRRGTARVGRIGGLRRSAHRLSQWHGTLIGASCSFCECSTLDLLYRPHQTFTRAIPGSGTPRRTLATGSPWPARCFGPWCHHAVLMCPCELCDRRNARQDPTYARTARRRRRGSGHPAAAPAVLARVQVRPGSAQTMSLE